MQSIKVFPLVFTLLIFLSSYLTATVYEDAEDGNTAGWRVYDNTPSGAQVLNVYDNDRGSNVIQLQGDLTNNGYILGGWEGSADAWGDSSSTTITWSMKYNESYNIYIRVMTTNGARYIYYTPSDTSNGGTNEYVHLGLGTSTRNGTWLTFTRDLQADLAQFQPGNTITQINAFLVRGSGFIDDIEVGGAPIVPCTIQTPDNLVSNPCVEQSPTGWSAYGSTVGGWVANEGHSGTHSLKITNPSSQNSGWRYTNIPINNARTITFGGWSKAENVNAGALYALDFYVKFADGTDRWFAPQEIRFSTGTHDWEHKELTYTFDKDVVLVRPYLLLYYDTGTVWYDDIYVIPQTPSVPLAANAGPDQVIASGTDLVLDGSASTGTITSYAWDENGVAKGSTATLILSGLSSGTHTFRLTVTDSSGDTATDTVTIRVNAAPIANAGPDQNITLGDSVTLNGSGSTDDFGIVSYAWSESSIPINVSGVSPAVLISNAGTYTVTLTVTDINGESSTDTVVIRVNTPPVTEDMNLSTSMNTPITFTLTATDVDNDTNLTFPIETGPSHGTLSGPEDNLTYTPNLDFTGTDTFTYKAYDGTSYSELSTVTIEVYPPAMAVHDDYNTTYMTPFTGNVLDNDLGLNITLIDFNTTSHGTLNISSDGEFNYTPYFEWDGNDTFTYTIKDDFNNTSATTVSIRVFPPRSDLSISKSAPASIDAGFAMDYTLNISNAPGEQYLVADNVRVIDTLPPGVLYGGVTAPSGWTCGYLGATLTCDASNLAPGYNGSITIHVFAPNTLGNSTNTATITSDIIDPDLSNNSSSATTSITGADVDLSISKTVSSPTVSTADSFTYTIAVQNSGTADTSNVVVNDILDASLGFISINSGTDWTCSQGSTISCSYIANGGVFTAGNSANPIVITVRAPAFESTITNTASVHSSTPEANTANNTSSIDVSIFSGTTHEGDVPFSKFLQFNLNGDMKLIGNVNIWKSGSSEPGSSDNNNNFDMTFSDTDSDPTTFNSSWANLDLGNPNYEIVFAGLYWLGQICPDNYAECNNANAGGNYAALDNAKHTIKLMTPDDTIYRDITANTVNSYIDTTNNQLLYQGFADITQYAKSQGRYTIANLRTSEGKIYRWGGFGGWALQIVYRDPSHTLHYKNVSIFNGFRVVNGGTVDITVDGFLTPRTAPQINASLGFFVGDGDAGSISGDILEMYHANNNRIEEVTDSLNYTGTAKPQGGGIFNGSISELGSYYNDRSNAHTNNLGIDIDRLDVSDFMTTSQTSTHFTFTSGNDIHTISLISFATDLTTPIIDNFEKSAVIINIDGTRRIAEPNAAIYPGSTMEYTLKFKNTGDEVAEAVEIFDDFDFDGLTRTLDLDNFDTTQIKLFDGDNTTNLIANPDCGYDVGDRRVYCRLDSIAIDASYTMQFVVKVKDILDQDIFTTHAENTAYAKYRNPNGDIYVSRTTAPDGENVGGKSNGLNAGVFTESSSFIDTFITLDAINEHYDYNADRNITTKIVNQPFALKIIHKDRTGVYSPYQAWQGNYIMPVIITLEKDGDNSLNTGSQPRTLLNDPATTYFSQGVSDIIANNLNLTKAHRNDKIKLAYLDWNAILGAAPSTSPCRTSQTFSPNLNGLPACFNSYTLVKEVFPPNALPGLAVCYGQGAVPVEHDFPCDPLAYSTGGDQVIGSITPAAYNHNYGCYQCITQAHSAFRKDSSDEFAAKPDHFVISSNNPSFPDLLRAGLDYNVSIIARDGQGNPTQDYNTSIRTFSTGSVTKYLPDGDVDTNGDLEGDFNISTSGSGDLNMSNGISTTDNDLSTPEDIVTINYSNVGKIDLNITDPNWCVIDADDTPAECNATKNANDIPIETGRTICSDDANATFIPHHFKITAALHNHRDDSNVTYLSNDLNMSAHIEATIQAMNAQEQVTTNFKKDFYENPMTLDFNVTDWNTTFVLPSDRNGTDRPDVHLKKYAKYTTQATLFGFGENNDSNGTHTIDAHDTNISQRLMFNYARTAGSPKNPFTINGQEVNLTVHSTYTTTMNAPEGNADINGTGLASGKASFYYARIRPQHKNYTSQTRSQITPVYIEIFCNKGDTECRNRGIDDVEWVTNEYDWWKAVGHSMLKNDGNITLLENNPDGNISKPVLIINNSEGRDNNISVSTTKVPNHVDVDSNNSGTNSWLIHKGDPLFGVDFGGIETNSTTGMWTGHGNTGNVVDSKVHRNKNNRLGW